MGIVLSSSSGNASVHSTVLLVCVAGGSLPQPEITWHFSGSPIQTNVSTKVNVFMHVQFSLYVRIHNQKEKKTACNSGGGGWGAKIIIILYTVEMKSSSIIQEQYHVI